MLGWYQIVINPKIPSRPPMFIRCLLGGFCFPTQLDTPGRVFGNRAQILGVPGFQQFHPF